MVKHHVDVKNPAPDVGLASGNPAGQRTFLSVNSRNRPQDYLYDHYYLLSSPRDHARVTLRDQTSAKHYRITPNYDAMFSNLVKYPRCAMKYECHDFLPKCLQREWRGFQESAMETLINNCSRGLQDPTDCYHLEHWMATRRFNQTLSRPNVPIGAVLQPSDQCGKIRLEKCSKIRWNPDILVKIKEREEEELREILKLPKDPSPVQETHRTIGVITDYRSMDTQTDPYSPKYVVEPEGSHPEILDLASMIYGHGLPAGLDDVFLIERQRAYRAVMESFPEKTKTDLMWQLKYNAIEEINRCKWAWREKEIELLQDWQIEAWVALLKKREEIKNSTHIDYHRKLWCAELKDLSPTMKKIRNLRLACIRKLRQFLTVHAKKNLIRLKSRDVRKDYIDFGAQPFAPLTRVGQFTDRWSERNKVCSNYLDSYAGLCELERTSDRCYLELCLDPPKRSMYNKFGGVKRKYRYEQMLIEMSYTILAEKEAKAGKTRTEKAPPYRSRLLVKKPTPPARIITPTIPGEIQAVNWKYLATIVLQKSIRGRAIQAEAFEGMDRAVELIAELRSTHSLQDPEWCRQMEESVENLKKKQAADNHRQNAITKLLIELDSDEISGMLSFLSKELLRIREERRLHAMSLLIERQRRIREAEESGRRQMEERRRRESDEMFKQTVKLHQVSVDTYLEDIVLSAIEKTADVEARKEIKELAFKIDSIAHDLEHRRNRLMSEAIVAELVNSFLIPEVNKQAFRKRVQDHQARFLTAAHREIFKTGNEIITKFGRRT